MRVMIRGFAGTTVIFQEELDLPEDGDVGMALAERHVALMVGHPQHMIEIEFLDLPDQEERFLRFGTDPTGMILPIRLL